jgi:exodeoxyribonuclease VII small subunit
MTDVAKLTFEDAIGELETIVRRLEGGRATLDDSIRAYERGAQLKQHCEVKLAAAKARIDALAGDGARKR